MTGLNEPKITLKKIVYFAISLSVAFIFYNLFNYIQKNKKSEIPPNTEIKKIVTNLANMLNESTPIM